jgi:hypothetical protein
MSNPKIEEYAEIIDGKIRKAGECLAIIDVATQTKTAEALMDNAEHLGMLIQCLQGIQAYYNDMCAILCREENPAPLLVEDE